MQDNKQDDDLVETENVITWTDVLTDPKIAKSINTIADAWAKNLPAITNLQWKGLIANLTFGFTRATRNRWHGLLQNHFK